MLKNLVKVSLRNPVAVVLLVVLIVIGGVNSTTQFKQEQLPEIDIPGIIVTTVYPGAAPNEVLEQVTQPLEQGLRNLEGVKNVYSQSANNLSIIQLEYNNSDDMKRRQEEVRRSLAGIALPEGAQQPEVMYFSTSSSPILYTSVSGAEGVSEQELTDIVELELLPKLKAVDGVSDVQVIGLEDSSAWYVHLDGGKMAEYGIAYDQLVSLIQANNVSLPLGQTVMKDEILPVFVQGGLRSVEQLEQLSLAPDGSIRLRDVAAITQGKESGIISLTNGKPSITLNIVKSGAANTVEVADNVLRIYEEAEKGGKIRSLIMYNRAADVKESVRSLAQEGLLGALFASLVILLFLRNVRATLIAIVSIPLSMLIAAICLKSFTDVTLNMMTLGGMAVATGRVVDDSIVVIENLIRRMKGERISKDLIVSATIEVGKAIVSSTLTTVAVFVPLGMLQGMVGGFFRPFALTVGFALMASLLAALTVVPLMAWVLLQKGEIKAPAESSLSKGYKRLLGWSLRHKAVVLAVSTLLFIGSLIPIIAGKVGVVLMPETDYKYMFATLEMPKGTAPQAVEAEAKRLDEMLRGHADVTNTNVIIGGGINGEAYSYIAEWFIAFKPGTDLDRFIEEIGPRATPSEGSHFSLVKDDMTGGGAVEITVTASSKDQLRMAAERVVKTLEGIEGITNIGSNLQDGTNGIAIEVRQEDAARYGLTAYQAYALLRPYMAETKVGMMSGGELYFTLKGETLNSPESLAALPVQTPTGTVIRVKDVADVRQVQLPSTLQYKNGAEYVTVTAKISGKDASKVNKELMKALDALELPEGAELSVGGNNAEVQQMISDMLMAMLVAVVAVYVVMVAAFGEGRAPLAILFSLPFALIGGLAGTLITGEPLSASSLIGFLMLIGIVVTNAIVLVERVQQQIKRGLAIREALVEAGGTRLRPILMTAIATICALVPLAAGVGGGSVISGGLAVVVIGGLASSTLLTLVVVPVMYELLYFKKSRLERRLAQNPLAEATA